MRKHLILALSLSLVAALAAGAQTSSSTSNDSSSSTTTSSTTSGTKMSSTMSSTKKYHRANGDITTMDAASQTFTITHGKKSWTFKTDNATKVKGLGKAISFADLQVGDNVRVSYTQSGGDNVAARIDVLHGKKTTG
jgi:ABC-type glycerol-3-phosphate transport system substrate-binding protein